MCFYASPAYKTRPRKSGEIFFWGRAARSFLGSVTGYAVVTLHPERVIRARSIASLMVARVPLGGLLFSPRRDSVVTDPEWEEQLLHFPACAVLMTVFRWLAPRIRSD